MLLVDLTLKKAALHVTNLTEAWTRSAMFGVDTRLLDECVRWTALTLHWQISGKCKH